MENLFSVRLIVTFRVNIAQTYFLCVALSCGEFVSTEFSSIHSHTVCDSNQFVGSHLAECTPLLSV